MELKETVFKRRSIRKYKTQPVPKDSVNRILEIAYQAPSGANASPWHYVIVDDSKLKSEIRKASEAVDASWNAQRPEWFKAWLSAQGISQQKKFLEDAPYLLVVFADTRMPYAVESTWISIGYAILAATQEGLGTLTYTPGDPSFLNKLLNMPHHYAPQAVLPLGYPDEAPEPRTRRKKEAPRI